MKRMWEKEEIEKIATNPQSLVDVIKGSDEVNVDVSEDNKKVIVSLTAKKVVIEAPSTATSGTLTEEQLSALKESTNSFIMFNNEKYVLNDEGHAEGSLGYSHVGVENGVFMIKNITITESTKAWVLTTNEDEVLWVNENPTQEFEASEISIPTLNQYKQIVVIYKKRNDVDDLLNVISYINSEDIGISLINYRGGGATGQYNSTSYREIYFKTSTNVISIGSARYENSQTTTATNNVLLIPIKIIGIK